MKKKHGKKRKKGEGVFHHGPPLALPLDDGGASDRLDADPPSGAPSDGALCTLPGPPPPPLARLSSACSEMRSNSAAADAAC